MEKPGKYIQRRAFKRIPSNVQVKFFYGNSVYFGIVMNYSEKGLYVSTKRIFFPVHAQFELYILSHSDVLKLPVKVSRLVKRDSMCYGMGVELLDKPENYSEIMKKHERNNFEGLKAQAECSKHFACVSSTIRDVCNERYDMDNDLIECLNCTSQPCDFTKTFAARFICTCPLRNYIVTNFDQWIVDSVDRIRRCNL